jgi:hypothetical protein
MRLTHSLLIQGTWTCSLGWAALHPQTEILTHQGLRPLGQLVQGELVQSISQNKILHRAVASLGPQKVCAGFVLTIESAGELLCSEDQLFWTARGWLAARDLHCGEQLLSADGSWKSLLFPPLPTHASTMSLSLTPISFDDPEEDRVMWVGPSRILCHNDCVIVPIISITLGTGEIIWASAATIATAATALSAWWLASSAQEILPRFGHPNEQILQLSPTWLQGIQQNDLAFLHAASWHFSEPCPPQLITPAPPQLSNYHPMVIPIETLPPPLQQRLRAQLEHYCPTEMAASPRPQTQAARIDL